MHLTDQITEIAPYKRTYFWVTFLGKYDYPRFPIPPIYMVKKGQGILARSFNLYS